MTDITNCRNCGAPLTPQGKCLYCGTTYKRANVIDVPQGEPLDLELCVKQGDTVTIVPLRGRINSITFSRDSLDCMEICGTQRILYSPTTNVEFDFEGIIVG